MDDRNQKIQTHVGTPEGKDGLKVPDVDIPSTLSPSATIRDLYYQSQKMQEEHYDTVRPSYQTQQEVVAKNNSHQRKYDDNSSIYDLSSHVMDDDDDKDDENDFIYRSTATFMHFKEATPSLYSLSDAGSVFSLRTIYNDSDDGKVVPPPSSALGNTERSRMEEMRAVSPIPSRSSNIIAKRALEPKIVVHHKEESRPLSTSSSNLLSRFSKSTAPARAKLFSAPRTNHLRAGSATLTVPSKHSSENIRQHVPRPRVISDHSMELARLKEHHAKHPHFPKLHDQIPLVYPALLSKVAMAFKERVSLSTKVKDGIEYAEAFDGTEAVDKIVYIIKTSDRNLAVLLGRALDAQKFFHDVNYEHRLRDEVFEIYQFKEVISTPLPQNSVGMDAHNDDDDYMLDKSESGDASAASDLNAELPTGVFTLLTECYSPTCTPNKLCYSIACPRRLEQQARANLSLISTLERSISKSSVTEEEERLWINTVSKDIVKNISKQERKRQETIFELIYTEKDFVQDLEYLEDFWINPLLESDISESPYREQLVEEVFWNIADVHGVNSALLVDLEKRQAEKPIVDRIGDILLSHVDKFEPFVQYGAHQVFGKFAFESERSKNPAFAAFVTMVERQKQSRKLELNGYLTKPTTRLGRYNLLLKEILKNTPEDHPDSIAIPKAMAIIKTYLSKVNAETGKAENKFNLMLLKERLVSKDATQYNLELDDEHRQLISKGQLKKKETGSESSDLHVFLLDRYLLIAKQKYMQKAEKYKLYRPPIPLQLLSVSLPDIATKRVSSILPSTGTGRLTGAIKSQSTSDLPSMTMKASYPIVFLHLGREGAAPVTLYCSTSASRRQLVDKIEKQRQTLTQEQIVFRLVNINSRYFSGLNRVRCVSYLSDGTLVYGADQGVYVQKSEGNGTPMRAIALDRVSQIHILEESRLILVLSDKTLYTYSIDALMAGDTAPKRGRRVSKHVSFFKVGYSIDRTLVCVVKSSTITSTIRTLEPVATNDPKKSKSNFGRLIRGSSEALKIYKDLYIPGEATSLHIFRSNICVGCDRGFEMVNLASMRNQSVLDPSDEALSFVFQRENIKPISMFKLQDGEFLLCYNPEIAFYVDKKGKRARNNWMVEWEGHPLSFALRYPYLVAFDTTFIEVRHVETVCAFLYPVV
ncbi:CNH domain-containing protein [Umbelopsis sp. PMI_123]|nr:CNH domain-containing protein [Umbelopsis sp. PMI_123]